MGINVSVPEDVLWHQNRKKLTLGKTSVASSDSRAV
jgi:hypothetical protein